MPPMTDSFSRSFAEARHKFIAAAQDAGAEIHDYGRDDLVGKDGERLVCDVAVLGPSNADKAIIAICGTHGSEGYCGSAIFHRWLLSDGVPREDGKVKVVLVHAINPWAFSHKTRTTENHVDLNRNFLSSYAHVNLAYDRLAPFFHSETHDAAQSLAAHIEYKSFLDHHGWHLENEVLAGQTHRPDGLFYAGKEPERANRVFRTIVNDHLRSAEKIGFIDWHTGVGKFGEIVHLVFDEAGSPEHAAAEKWWSEKRESGTSFNSGAVPKYEGLLCKAIRQELSGPRIAGAVIEFGTADDYGMFRGDRLDRWLRFEGRNDPQHDELREDYMECCCPRDVSWRRLVLREGPRKMDQLIQGMRGW